jgi:hypothetical protein
MSDDGNLIDLSKVREAREEAEDEVDAEDEADATRMVWVVDEGESSFVALRSPPPVDGEVPDRGLEPDEVDQLALEMVRAAAKCRALRGE